MLHRPQTQRRRGAVLATLAICIIFLVGLMALAIDIGMIAVARNQCQNAADSAAMAGARTINGNVAQNYNYANVPGNAVKAAVNNRVFGQTIPGDPTSLTQQNAYTYQSGQVTVAVGAYSYVYNDSNVATEGFQLQFPKTDGTAPYSAVQATVNFAGNFAFARVFGLSTFNTSAVATAIHRPRDVMVVLDLSGSMRFQSLPGVPMSGSNAYPSSGSSARTQSMNPDPIFPTFGHYSAVAAAALQNSNQSFIAVTGESVDPSNVTSTQNSGPPVCADFYANAVGVPPGPGNVAFSTAPTSYATTPGGDNYLPKNGTSTTPPTYASTVQEITNGKVFQGYTNPPYTGYTGPTVPEWSGYTQGPNYWGKTFFIWPPDPRGPATATADATNAANWANNGSKDWRQRFFFKVNNSSGALGWLDHNNILFNGDGHFNNPATNTTVTENGASVAYHWRVNYAAIFQWLFNDPSGTNPFPATLQAGRIRYYTKLPDPSDTTLNTRFWAADVAGNSGQLSDPSERFWKDYIHFILGLQGTGPGTYTRYQPNGGGPWLTSLIGNGDTYQWGASFQIKDRPDPSDTSAYQTAQVNKSGGYAAGYSGAINIASLTDVPLVGDTVTIGSDSTQYKVAAISSSSVTLNQALVKACNNNDTVSFWPYMDYNDNPYRPRHQFWFGPQTFVDWLGNYNLITLVNNTSPHHWWPGNCHEAHAWACKVGVQTAIGDIQNNHPNDFVGMTFFSSPMYSNSGHGHHNRACVSFGRNYQQMIDSLWFPPTTVTGGVSEISPFDPDMFQVPRSDGGTSPGMGFMIAYNQLSSSLNLRFYATPSSTYRGSAGGLGRQGANRLIIFETDGFPNTRSVASFQSAGVDSFYPIRIKNPADLTSGSNVEWPSGGGYSDNEVFSVIQQIVAPTTASDPGYSTPLRPVLIYGIGYGSIFDPANAGTSSQNTALAFLQNVQYYGNTSPSASTPIPASQLIYGSNQQRINSMRAAFTSILQSGVQVSLIQ
jgi:hypothetical protein